MAERLSKILDQWGRPIDKSALTAEIAAPTVTGLRSPLTGYPGDGLNPRRLAAILREADAGDPLRYLELAETIEERDLHYLGVLGTRKRAVSQLEITVEPASDSAEHERQAEMVRQWLTRDELQGEIFDMLDAVGKGYSFTEITWDTSEGQWQPRRLEWRDPRWFRFSRIDGRTPLLVSEHGEELPLPGFKFVSMVLKAKSGLPARSGIARVASWAWMFKAFTNRDWAIFTQTYGQPVRIGKYGPGATDREKETLFNAVANIAGDCAAIIPDSMLIEFVEAKSVGASVDLYLKRTDHLDQQVSKAVLGQTATTDAIAGGHAVGQEHRQVQEDIERADSKAGSATLNADLVRPWIMLEFGPQDAYPRLKIGRAEETDVAQAVDAVSRLVPMGLKVGQNQMRDIIGIGAPADGDELLAAPARPEPAAGVPGTEERPAGRDERQALHQEQTPRPEDVLAAAAQELAAAPAGRLIDAVRALVDRAGSLEELKAVLRQAQDEGGTAERANADLALAMRQAMVLAALSGRAEMLDDGTALQANFDPDQPRVPKGNPTGGEWTDDPAHGTEDSADWVENESHDAFWDEGDPVFYHVAPADAEDAILTSGIVRAARRMGEDEALERWFARWAERLHRDVDEIRDNFAAEANEDIHRVVVFDDLATARRWAEYEERDMVVFEIADQDLELSRDYQADEAGGETGAWSTREIEPRSIRRRLRLRLRSR